MKIERSPLASVLVTDAGKGKKPEITKAAESASSVTQFTYDSLSDKGDVNIARVNELRQAISEGRLAIDAEKIADALIASTAELLGQ